MENFGRNLQRTGSTEGRVTVFTFSGNRGSFDLKRDDKTLHVDFKDLAFSENNEATMTCTEESAAANPDLCHDSDTETETVFERNGNLLKMRTPPYYDCPSGETVVSLELVEA